MEYFARDIGEVSVFRRSSRAMRRKIPRIPLAGGYDFEDTAPTVPIPVIPHVEHASYYVPDPSPEALPPAYPDEASTDAPSATLGNAGSGLPSHFAAEQRTKAWPARGEPMGNVSARPFESQRKPGA